MPHKHLYTMWNRHSTPVPGFNYKALWVKFNYTPAANLVTIGIGRTISESPICGTFVLSITI